MALTIILDIILAILIILLVVMLWLASYINRNNRFMVPKEEKYGVDIGLKALIIYQPSKHNTTYNMVMAAVDVFVKNGYEHESTGFCRREDESCQGKARKRKGS